MSIIAKFYPNGEFSQGIDTSKRRRENRKHRETRTEKLSLQCRHQYLEWYEEYNKKNLPHPNQVPLGTKLLSFQHEYVLEEREEHRTVLSFQDTKGKKYYLSVDKSFSQVVWEFRLTPLVHQMVESCEKPQSRKKLPCMTKHMARNIRNAVYLLERQPGGKDVLSFLTLTLPDLSRESLEICCTNWDKIVKRFFDWLRKHLEKYNMQLQHVYCTEIQMKRLEKRHEYAPHLHVVYRGRHAKKSPWLTTPKQVRKAWTRCLRGFIGESFRTDALENLQRIKRSAARYLSKYLSKSTRPFPEGSNQDHQPSIRTQWGGMARSLSRDVRRYTCRLSDDGEFRESIIYFVTNIREITEKGFVRYFKRGFIPLSKCEATGVEYGLHVLAGCLASPALEGGLTRLLEFCQFQSVPTEV